MNPIWIELILGFCVMAFLGRTLSQRTKNPVVAATLLAAFFWAWIDSGGWAGAQKMGAGAFLKQVSLDFLLFVFLWCLAFGFTPITRKK